MAKKFAELQARMTPQSQAEAKQLFQQHLKEMPLHELRKAQQLSQENLAKALNINQAAVSKMERRTDMYISTLRNYIQAMGGELDFEGISWDEAGNRFVVSEAHAALMSQGSDDIAITEVAGGCVCCVNGAPFQIGLSRLLRMNHRHVRAYRRHSGQDFTRKRASHRLISGLTLGRSEPA